MIMKEKKLQYNIFTIENKMARELACPSFQSQKRGVKVF